MKKLFTSSVALVALLSASLLLTAGQQQNQPQERNDQEAKVYRASHLTGLTIRNTQDENLGHVEDIVINLEKGEVVYYALGREQVVGFGGKLFAIAPEAMKLHADEKNYPQHFILDVSAQELGDAKGFDHSAWPREPDQRWGKARDRKDIGEKVKEKVKEAAKDVREGIKGKDNLTRITALMRMGVRNTKGDNLGSAFDMAIDVANNKLVYVAVSRTGPLGVGGKLHAVPWQAMQFDALDLRPGQRAFVINATEQDFERTRGFTSDQAWPTSPDPAFKGLRKEDTNDREKQERDRD